jgi:hypothetical protein
MRGLSIYLMAGALLVVALDFIAPPVGPGLDVATSPAVDRDASLQFVDRTHKSDRLHAPSVIGRRQVPRKPVRVMIGCEPVFSPLSAAMRTNFPARCIAELAIERAAEG